MATIYCFTNAKGGVGKTSITSSIASIAAGQGKRVLMIDLDSQANLTSGFCHQEGGIPNEDTIISSLKDGTDLSIYETQIPNLDIVPGYKKIDDLPEELAGLLNAQEIEDKVGVLREKLHNPEIQEAYDMILIDTSPSMNLITRMAYAASDRLIVITCPGQWELDGIVDVRDTTERVRKFNPTIDIYKIVLNKYKRWNDPASPETERLIIQTPIFRQYVDTYIDSGNVERIAPELVIPESSTMTRSQLSRRDVNTFNSKSFIVEEFRSLANKIIAETLN